MSLCVCEFLDMLCSEDQDVHFTCKVRTLLGGEDGLLCSSKLQTSALRVKTWFFRIRFPSKGPRNLSHIMQALLARLIQQKIVFTKDIADKNSYQPDRQREEERETLLLVFMPFFSENYLTKAMWGLITCWKCSLAYTYCLIWEIKSFLFFCLSQVNHVITSI